MGRTPSKPLSPSALISALELDDPEERAIASGVSWKAYETVLVQLEDNSHYRVSYLDGVLEIVSPSRAHELRKERIGALVESYLRRQRIWYEPLGSTTFTKPESAGKEPDKSYCIGTSKAFPDLAIEIVMTSEDPNTLQKYHRLGVREVWIWKGDRLQIYGLRSDGYELVDRSEVLSDLDIVCLTECIQISDPMEALDRFEAELDRQSKLK